MGGMGGWGAEHEPKIRMAGKGKETDYPLEPPPKEVPLSVSSPWFRETDFGLLISRSVR